MSQNVTKIRAGWGATGFFVLFVVMAGLFAKEIFIPNPAAFTGRASYVRYFSQELYAIYFIIGSMIMLFFAGLLFPIVVLRRPYVIVGPEGVHICAPGWVVKRQFMAWNRMLCMRFGEHNITIYPLYSDQDENQLTIASKLIDADHLKAVLLDYRPDLVPLPHPVKRNSRR